MCRFASSQLVLVALTVCVGAQYRSPILLRSKTQRKIAPVDSVDDAQVLATAVDNDAATVAAIEKEAALILKGAPKLVTSKLLQGVSESPEQEENKPDKKVIGEVEKQNAERQDYVDKAAKDLATEEKAFKKQHRKPTEKAAVEKAEKAEKAAADLAAAEKDVAALSHDKAIGEGEEKAFKKQNPKAKSSAPALETSALAALVPRPGVVDRMLGWFTGV